MYYNYKKKAKKNENAGLGSKNETSKSNHSSSSGSSGGSGKHPLKPFFILAAVFLAGLAYLYTVYLYWPEMEETEKQTIKLPTSIDDAKSLGRVLKKYNQDHYYIVMISFFSYYVFMQTFAIPGSTFLSILSGFLYPFPLAVLLVCSCTTIGAAFCYVLSQIAAKKIVIRYWRVRVLQFQKKVDTLKNDLLWYVIFLRVTPFVPNWFINLTSPIINIPLHSFLVGTFIGVAPPSLIHIQGGKTLNELVSTSSVFSFNSILVLVFVSALSLAPVVVPKLFPKWFVKFNPKLTN
jgi:uncharacterized membrane protein YdjX (TVP38/TMEM64 family)